MHRRSTATGGASSDEAIDHLRDTLRGESRREIVRAITSGRDTSAAFAELRRCMRSHRWPGQADAHWLQRVVEGLDARTRREGLHVLHGWDFRSQRRPEDIVPILLTDYVERLGVPDEGLERAVAILVDQYFLAVLMLPTVRAWDGGDPNARLDAITGLLADLNGPRGGGLAMVRDAESLLLLAVAYYHPEEGAYDHQLAQVRTVDGAHALRFAYPCAAIMGTHLRWGLRFMYRSDVGTMRADNAVDYPWSLFALATLMGEYERLQATGATRSDRLRCVHALMQGLSADPWAFDGKLPAFLTSHAVEHETLRRGLDRHREALIADAEAAAPSAGAYSPLGFSCNFLSNAVVASVMTAISSGRPTPSLNALLAPDAALADGPPGANQAGVEALAERLMAFATGAPERLAARGAPIVSYDRRDGAHYHNIVMRCLREGALRPDRP